MLKDSYLACKSALEKGGIENAAFEAQCMLEHLTGFGRASLLAHGGDAFDRQDELDEMIKRRLKNEPLQYILGSWSFCGIELLVGEGVLIPRVSALTSSKTKISRSALTSARAAALSRWL